MWDIFERIITGIGKFVLLLLIIDWIFVDDDFY